MPTHTPETQLFVSPDRPEPERLDPVRNHTMVKPRGGLWTSTRTPDGSSGWIDWCKAEQWWPSDPDEARVWALDPEPGVETFAIDAVEDLTGLLGEFGRDSDPDLPAVLTEDTLDYERFFAETAYSGLTLTERGQAVTRFARPGLYGWDCESTVWCEWAFENVRLYAEDARAECRVA